MNKLFNSQKIILVLSFITIAAFISCTKEYSNESGNAFAQGTLKDSSGNCLLDSVTGAFYANTPPDPDTDFVEVKINITKAGSYNISTDIQNGFHFADSGYVSNIGDTIIHLKPIGVPIDTGATFFTISFDNDACYFFVDVKDSIDATIKPGDWQFTQGSFVYNGNFHSALKNNFTDTSTEVILDGGTFSGDTTISIDFTINAVDVEPGTYTTANNAIVFSMIDAITPSILFTSNPSAPGTNMTIIVTSYDSTTQEMKGTFSGNARTGSGSIVPLKNGFFEVKLI